MWANAVCFVIPIQWSALSKSEFSLKKNTQIALPFETFGGRLLVSVPDNDGDDENALRSFNGEKWSQTNYASCHLLPKNGSKLIIIRTIFRQTSPLHEILHLCSRIFHTTCFLNKFMVLRFIKPFISTVDRSARCKMVFKILNCNASTPISGPKHTPNFYPMAHNVNQLWDMPNMTHNSLRYQ